VNRNASDEIYSENYDDTAVMFASITNFSVEEMGQGFLRTMSTIISVFDLVRLITAQFVFVVMLIFIFSYWLATLSGDLSKKSKLPNGRTWQLVDWPLDWATVKTSEKIKAIMW
jgi:hypothetical protein